MVGCLLSFALRYAGAVWGRSASTFFGTLDETRVKVAGWGGLQASQSQMHRVFPWRYSGHGSLRSLRRGSVAGFGGRGPYFVRVRSIFSSNALSSRDSCKFAFQWDPWYWIPQRLNAELSGQISANCRDYLLFDAGERRKYEQIKKSIVKLSSI